MRVSDVAYEKIKMMIITARLRPGQTLVEAELMEELGIEDEDESEDDLYRTFETIDINQFR